MKWVGISVLIYVLCIQPVSVHAQLTAAEHRTQLQVLITLLEERIAVLQSALLSKQSAPALTGRYAAQVDIKVVHTIAGDGTWQIANQAHRQYLEELQHVWPSHYSARVVRFVVFDEKRSPFDAYVESLDGGFRTWEYGVVDDLLYQPQSAANQELMLHELGHVWGYDAPPGEVRSWGDDCAAYFAETVCPSKDSYFGLFVDEFWSAGQLRDASRRAHSHDIDTAASRYYTANPYEYVSEYAARNPEEDFAESFMYYLLDLPVLCEGCVASDKVDFFEQFPEIVLYKKTL